MLFTLRYTSASDLDYILVSFSDHTHVNRTGTYRDHEMDVKASSCCIHTSKQNFNQALLCKDYA